MGSIKCQEIEKKKEEKEKKNVNTKLCVMHHSWISVSVPGSA